MRRPEIPQAHDQPSSPAFLGDYFWIAGLDGQELLDAYIRIAADTTRPSSYGVDDTIQEDAVAESDAPSIVRSSGSIVRHGSRNSYYRLSQLSDEARLSMLTLDSKPIGSSSNRSSATVRAIPPSPTRMSTMISDVDFDNAMTKFTSDRDRFYLDLSFHPPSPVQRKPSGPRAKTHKIVAEEAPPTPTRGLGSLRRHISFKEMASVKRQLSLARNVSVRSSRRLSSYNAVIPSPESLRTDPTLHPLKQKFEPALLDRFPRKGSAEEVKRQCDFPDYIPMFAFPDDVRVIASETRPRSTWHGFSMTAGDNSRLHAICVVVWIPMGQQAANELDKRSEEWRRANLTDAERELAASLVDRLATERAKLSELLAELPAAVSDSDDREDLEEEISTVEERINMMAEMLRPLLHGSTSRIEGLADGNSGIWIPRAYGVLGRESTMTGFWKEWLRAIAVPMLDGGILRVPPSSPKIGMWQPVERYIMSLCVDSPAPSTSRTQIEIAVRDLRLYARKEATNELPGSRTTDLYPLFRALSIANIVLLFEYVLQESRVILLSSHTAMLQLVSKSIIELIWPLQWSGVYIPVLPARLIQALEAPCPYICGVDRKYEKIEYPDDDFVLVDLDKNEIQSTGPPFQLPRQQRRKLISLLHLAAPVQTSRGSDIGPPAYATESFPNDSFSAESHHLFSAVTRSTNLAKFVTINSTSFGPQATSDSLRYPPIFNAFLQTGTTRSRSADGRPRTASTTRNSNRDTPLDSPVSAAFPGLSGTPMSRNDSRNALQSSLRGKRSGNFDSINSRRSGSISNATRRPSLPFIHHGPSLSNHTNHSQSNLARPPSSYAPSTYAQSTMAASTIMPGINVSYMNGPRNTETTTWTEGHCLERQTDSTTATLRVNCTICDERPDEPGLGSPNYRCSGCSINIHGRCIPQVSLPCPASFFPDQIRATFVRCFASLFYTHKKFIHTITSYEEKRVNPGLARKFDTQGMIRSLGGPGYEHAEYITMLDETQMWHEFIGEREVNPSTLGEEARQRIALFDAIILAKRGRSSRFGDRLRILPGPLGKRMAGSSSSSPFSSKKAGGGSSDAGAGAKEDILNSTAEHTWRTVTAPGAAHSAATSYSERIEYPASLMKGRDYHDIVTRVPAKLEDGLFTRPPRKTSGAANGPGGAGRRHRMNGLSMHAPGRGEFGT